MAREYSNIVLVGMPGAGKSTVGVILAKRTSRDFVDTDVLIQVAQNRSLQQILDADGYLALREVEEHVLLGLTCRNHVIATGGSAAYSDRAMAHLREHGVVVFLEVSLDTARQRVRDFDTRGIARSPTQSLSDLFSERQVLYRRYADLTVRCDDLGQEDVVAAICRELAAVRSLRSRMEQ